MEKSLPSYLGDMINGIEFNEKARIPDPDRMIKAYNQAASTQNLLKGICLRRLCRFNNHSKLEFRFC